VTKQPEHVFRALTLLAMGGMAMERAGGWLVIAGARGRVKEVLELTHVDRVSTTGWISTRHVFETG